MHTIEGVYESKGATESKALGLDSIAWPLGNGAFLQRGPPAPNDLRYGLEWHFAANMRTN